MISLTCLKDNRIIEIAQDHELLKDLEIVESSKWFSFSNQLSYSIPSCVRCAKSLIDENGCLDFECTIKLWDTKKRNIRIRLLNLLLRMEVSNTSFSEFDCMKLIENHLTGEKELDSILANCFESFGETRSQVEGSEEGETKLMVEGSEEGETKLMETKLMETKLMETKLMDVFRKYIFLHIEEFPLVVRKSMQYFKNMSLEDTVSYLESNTSSESMIELCVQFIDQYAKELNGSNYEILENRDFKIFCIEIVLNKPSLIVNQLDYLCEAIVSRLQLKDILLIWNHLFPNHNDQVANSNLINRAIVLIEPNSIVRADDSYSVLSKNIYFKKLLPVDYFWKFAYTGVYEKKMEWFDWSVKALDEFCKNGTRNFYIWNNIYCLYLLQPILKKGFTALHRTIVRTIVSSPSFEWMLGDENACLLLEDHLNEKDIVFIYRTHNAIMTPLLKHICLSKFNVRPLKRSKK
jgi:hypothetical protein